MSNAEVLKQFLIDLGFHVDSGSFKKFDEGVLKATSKVMKLGAAATATAAAIGVVVGKVAERMEDLYYVSQRTGSTVQHIQALQFAASTIGLTADQARGAIESLARAMRANPGNEGLLNALGIRTKGRDTSDVLADLIGQLKKMPFFIAQQYGSMFGIDPDTLLMLEQGYDRLRKSQQQYADIQKEAGINTNDLAHRSRDFMNDLRGLEARFGVLLDLVEDHFLPVADKFVVWVTYAMDGVLELDKATKGWSTTIGTIAISAMGAWIAKAVLMRTVFQGLVKEGAEAAAAAAGGGAAATAGTAAASGAGAGWLARLFALSRFATGIGAFLATMTPSTANAGEDEYVRKRNAEWAKRGGPFGKHMTIGVRQNNPGNLRSWGVVPTAHGYAVFPTPEAGLSAMAGNLLSYGSRGFDTLSAIIRRWAPPGENNTGAYLADVMKRTGFAANQHLNLRDPETLRAIMSAMITHEQGYNPYSQSMIMAGINDRLGGGVTLHQKTEIHVSGSSDPHGTADAIANRQDRVNGDLIRNTVGALR